MAMDSFDSVPSNLHLRFSSSACLLRSGKNGIGFSRLHEPFTVYR